MFFNNLNNNFNYYIHKYGVIVHSLVLLYILYKMDMHPNNSIYWAFLINLGALIYFVFIGGVAFGIKQTLFLSAQIQAEKEDIDDINRNN